MTIDKNSVAAGIRIGMKMAAMTLRKHAAKYPDGMQNDDVLTMACTLATLDNADSVAAQICEWASEGDRSALKYFSRSQQPNQSAN
jgi:hypothetical protein